MTRVSEAQNKVQVKLALAKKYMHKIQLCKSKHQRQNWMIRVRQYRNQADEIARQAGLPLPE